MRIAFIIPDLGDGGAQIQCMRLLNGLCALPGFEILLIYMHAGVNAHVLDGARCRVVHLPTRSNYNPYNVIKIARVLSDFKPDLLYTWLHACDVYGFFLKKFMRRCVWIMAERDSAYPREMRYMLRERLGRHADAIICNSVAGKKYWEGLGATCPLYFIPNIVRIPKAIPARPHNAPIMYVGRLEPQKNVAVLAQAFIRLAMESPGLEFEIVGEGSQRNAIADMVQAAGVADRILLPGFRRDARDRIGGARLLVTLSNHEGTPNVLLEAVAADTRVVTSDIPEHRAVLGPDYPFMISDRTNVDSCVQGIRNALCRVEAPEDYAFATRVLTAMTMESVTRQYVAVFGELLAAHRR